MAPQKGFQKDAWQVFDRVPYGTAITADVLRIYGYSSVPHPYHGVPTATVAQCQKLNDICEDHFTDEFGNRCYAYVNKVYFFPTEDDAHLFRSLLLLI